MAVFTVLGIIFSILVVSTSTVFSVLWLVGTFIVISLMLALLNLGFPALIYVIVYIGAIAILFLFVIQLLDSESKAHGAMNVSREQPMGPLAFLFSFGMMTTGVTLSNIYTKSASLYDITHPLYSLFNEEQFHLFFKEDNIILNNLTVKTGVSTQVESFAEWLYGPGLLPLIVVSVVLLVAMIAPIYLCKEA